MPLLRHGLITAILFYMVLVCVNNIARLQRMHNTAASLILRRPRIIILYIYIYIYVFTFSASILVSCNKNVYFRIVI